EGRVPQQPPMAEFTRTWLKPVVTAAWTTTRAILVFPQTSHNLEWGQKQRSGGRAFLAHLRGCVRISPGGRLVLPFDDCCSLACEIIDAPQVLFRDCSDGAVISGEHPKHGL